MFENERDARVYELVQETFSMLDAETYPETSRALAQTLAEAETEGLPQPLELANRIACLDRPLLFPDCVIDALTELYEMEIAQGSGDAMNDLGAMYYGGSRGFEQSFEKAVRYYQMAAEHGSRQAQENLGYCYYYGRNMEKPDYEKAFHYFALGAFDGHPSSLYKIGDMYFNGYYVDRNEREAFRIYRHCLDILTEDEAPRVAGQVFLRLGNMHLNGLGTEQDPSSALVCYQKAEIFLYDMVKGGSAMYRRSLKAAMEGQHVARALLMAELPDGEWPFDD